MIYFKIYCLSAIIHLSISLVLGKFKSKSNKELQRQVITSLFPGINTIRIITLFCVLTLEFYEDKILERIIR